MSSWKQENDNRFSAVAFLLFSIVETVDFSDISGKLIDYALRKFRLPANNRRSPKRELHDPHRNASTSIDIQERA